MLDQLLGIFLLGLGITHPVNSNVKGDSIEVSGSHGSGSNSRGDSNGATGTSEDREASGRNQRSTGTSGSDVGETEHATGTSGRQTETREVENRVTRTQVLTTIREQEKHLKEVFDTRKAKQEKELETSQSRAKLNTETARKAFTAKLSTLKDSKKKSIAASLDIKIGELNKKRTTTMLAFLSKMQEVLDKIITRSSIAAKAGKDTSTLDSSVTVAQAAVASALTAVNTQAGKTYVASVTNDATLKNDMETTMKSLKADLDIVNGLIETAKKSVYNAYMELAKVMEEPVTSPTVTTTP